MNTAEVLVKILEDTNVAHIFGHPGEQILPMYKALEKSSIKHILTRHEQAAAHAADMYAHSTGNFSVCMSTASPGALNFVMAVATAYKDNNSVLVLTGDNPYKERLEDNFQSFDLPEVFENITFKNYAPSNGREAILALKEAIEIFKKEPRGPIHINLPKDVLMEDDVERFIDSPINYKTDYNYNQMNLLINMINSSKKPLIIGGSGVIWANACHELKEFAEKNNIPISTTYPARGIIDENNPINLGLVGIRGSSMSNFAYLHSDLIIVLGSRLSERTTILSSKLNNFEQKVVHVNIDKSVLKGKVKINGDVSYVLKELNSIDFNLNNKKWLGEIKSNDTPLIVDGVYDKSLPLRPQSAIQTIYDNIGDSYVMGDAGSHATWAMLLAHPDKYGKFSYSGALCPMGMGLPGAIGISLAHPGEKVVVINGDGGFQMCIEELATIREYNLPIIITLINNNQLGIIRQWEENIDENFRYEVDLKNPDFLTIVKGYGIEGERVNTNEEIETAIKKAMGMNGPYFIEINSREENIPLPNLFIPDF
ncbi:thiamine pyrophosphate-binding protein [uncultured Methanobrevibacter sp.]|uniref:thiamine pyrophosphate-binding protein n=1 Tax=uncultured Methanobrevibacter sp. TaxID=253161 RepID=UPI0025DC998D|nr:thiamine pyrophosphate-binding protein [uncultured Methanobrevibacter sp.]